jgi:hypothetical protein
MSEFMKADKGLTDDLNKATSYEDIVALLHNSVERSDLGVTRDPVSGQFVRKDSLSPEAKAAAEAAAAPKEINKVVSINGVDLTFTGESVEAVDISIDHAKKVAALLHDESAERLETETAEARAARIATNRVEADIAFRRGEIDTKTYLERTGAVEEYLAAQGFDVTAAANAQQTQDWAAAADEFKAGPGSDWPGGDKNMAILGNIISANPDLLNAADKVAALSAAYKIMQEQGTIFSNEPSAAQMEVETANMTPAQIMQRWKEGLGGDPEKANAEFLTIHSGGRLFDR